MTPSHRQLCDIAVRWLRRPFGSHGHGCAVSASECRISGSGRGEVPDAIGFRFSGHRDGTVVVEVKTSRSDFLADTRKPHRRGVGLGSWRYYMVPEGLVRLEELPERWGLVEVNERGHIRKVHGAAALVERYGPEIDAQIDAWRFESDRRAELSLLTRLMSRVGDHEALNRRLAKVNNENSRLLSDNQALRGEINALRADRLALQCAGLGVEKNGGSMAATTDTEKALAYYKNGMLHEAPPFVPARVKLHCRVRGDGPFAGTFADAGEHDCRSNRWGAISVRAVNGQMLGVKPAEFDVVAWRPNA